MAAPPYATPLQKTWHYALRVICGLIFFFLIAPIVVIIPLSFNSIPYFTYPMELNDSGMITMIGAIRKKKMRPQITRSV